MVVVLKQLSGQNEISKVPISKKKSGIYLKKSEGCPLKIYWANETQY